VVDPELLSLSPAQLERAEVSMTVVAGRCVYSSNGQWVTRPQLRLRDSQRRAVAGPRWRAGGAGIARASPASAPAERGGQSHPCRIAVAWQLAADSHVIDAFFWSKRSQIWEAFENELDRSELSTDIYYTAAGALLGIVVGTAIGTAFGMALWWSSFVARVFDPYLVSWNAMPKVALAPLVTVTLASIRRYRSAVHVWIGRDARFWGGERGWLRGAASSVVGWARIGSNPGRQRRAWPGLTSRGG